MTNAGFTLILEDIRDQNRAVLEAVSNMQDQIKTLATKAELRAVATDVTTIKLAVTETNKDVTDHERRITRLEAKTA